MALAILEMLVQVEETLGTLEAQERSEGIAVPVVQYLRQLQQDSQRTPFKLPKGPFHTINTL